MPKDPDPRQELLVKNWELVQEIIKTLGARSWQVKGWGLTIWWAVIGYAVSAHQPLLLVLLLIFIPIVLSIDASVRLLEEKYFEHSKAIEQDLHAISIGDTESGKSQPIGTSPDLPSRSDLRELFKFRRVGFWFPYLALVLTTVLALVALELTSEGPTPESSAAAPTVSGHSF